MLNQKENEMKRTNFNKNVLMHLATSNDIYRTNFNFIWFKNGLAYASNAHIIVRQNISEISNFNDEQIALLEGKRIHAASYKQILKYESVQITDSGMRCWITAESSILFEFSKITSDFTEMCDKIISEALGNEPKVCGKFGIQPTLLLNIKKAMGIYSFEGVILDIYTANMPIIVRPNKDDRPGTMGMIMPVMIMS